MSIGQKQYPKKAMYVGYWTKRNGKEVSSRRRVPMYGTRDMTEFIEGLDDYISEFESQHKLYLTGGELVTILRVSKQTLYNWRKLGLPHDIGGYNGHEAVYNPVELENWLVSKGKKTFVERLATYLCQTKFKGTKYSQI